MSRHRMHIIGPVERVTVIGSHGKAKVDAKIDTGASRTSVDIWLAAKIRLGPTVDVAKVRSALSRFSRKRPVVRGSSESQESSSGFLSLLRTDPT